MAFSRVFAPWLCGLLAMAVVLSGGTAQAGRTILSEKGPPPAGQVCPNPETADVDLEAYSGTWYEIGSTARFKSRTERNLVCITARYSIIPSGALAGNVRVRNDGYNTSSGEDTSIVGYAAAVGPGRLAVTFFPGAPPGDYRVIYLQGTVADKYEVAVVYSCEEGKDGGIAQGMFVLSRTPALPRRGHAGAVTVEALLDYTAAQGVTLEPDNGLVLTPQDPLTCGRHFDA